MVSVWLTCTSVLALCTAYGYWWTQASGPPSDEDIYRSILPTICPLQATIYRSTGRHSSLYAFLGLAEPTSDRDALHDAYTHQRLTHYRFELDVVGKCAAQRAHAHEALPPACTTHEYEEAVERLDTLSQALHTIHAAPAKALDNDFREFGKQFIGLDKARTEMHRAEQEGKNQWGSKEWERLERRVQTEQKKVDRALKKACGRWWPG